MINLNTAFEDEIYEQYLTDRSSVSPAWRDYFDKRNTNSDKRYDGSEAALLENGKFKPKEHPQAEKLQHTEIKDKDSIRIEEGEELIQLSSIQSRISDNMEESLGVPTATSIRAIPVKVLDENRKIINKYLQKQKKEKVSFTHLMGWAIVKALEKYPQMNCCFALKNGKPHYIKRNKINLGFAVDIIKKDGTRLLLVPNLKNADKKNFSQFIEDYDNLIHKTRDNKLSVDDLSGTTVSITNPGMIGTTASNPRLMKGQGLIVAIGTIEYPIEFQAVRPEVMTSLAISKVVNITSTYDHRIIQGAESAEFLAYIHKLLIGENHFYDQIFASLKIPFEPIRWTSDNTVIDAFGKIDEKEAIEKAAHVMLMINAYRVRGHLLASINPLGYESYYYPELDPAYYGFTIWDLDRVFHAEDTWEKNNLPLRDIIERLRETYCSASGFEFMHIQDPARKQWIMRQLEKGEMSSDFPDEVKIETLRKLTKSELFENLLHTKFIGSKRFSIEGGESVIVMLDKIFEDAAEEGLQAITLGMAHRGRLNVLVNNIGKSVVKIFDEFEGAIDPNSYHGSGDVKYHLGDTGTFNSKSGKTIEIILSPNPSHLELVNPVIEGMARALENIIDDRTHSKVLPILIHGDSAFAGQGIVAETLNLSQLEGYKTGGTIHIVINNQIGFTTNIGDSRSSVYCTDIGKMIQAPIIHVNGNDPEAVMKAGSFAFEYRKKFGTDIIIDMLCYRKYGHNEADEPSYTQPLLYKKIRSMKSVRELYEQELIHESVFSEDNAKIIFKEEQDYFNNLFIEHKKKNGDKQEKIGNIIDKKGNLSELNAVPTSVIPDILKQLTKSISTIPDGFSANPKLISLFKKRAEMFDEKKGAFDWAMAELLAFGSILLEGKNVRITGQDTRRGTFSQRHAVITDVENNDNYVPLNHIRDGQGRLRIYDSPLSELAVLGFEYGYSTIAKDDLTIWEAQFGDFANGAQAIIDQFISCAESKWGKTSNLVLLLPHSYDGQGPEHSSARLERFLQLCADNNMLVCNLTTPAQYFHALRRQVLLQNKKPLVLMTPKSMLRHPLAVSGLKEFTETNFRTIIDESLLIKENINKVLICSGKIYYDLLSERDKLNRTDIAIIRVEQLYPLDVPLLNEILVKYKKINEWLWVQEEPENQGGWRYIEKIINETFKFVGMKNQIYYIGRNDAAATATGSHKKHEEEQNLIIEKALK
ncbi:MAG: multifunctional oxoglutarate decarboxylase/oxoglutarate dehydrogenase thiamine pyrophosphate-binding subunit/dihydrolipoyllysine-residue succinyltransferase subunit [Bacteroidetes bacterium]|nr:MAG: multifunctional oxoglutarate decarboxylase/oxoglutarate dehydrogenase thiamine pyrophosphate-binding subunit/dihydrolipoyllysine-residue succinyltransferase subunit [Bacteroidota bacterium]